MGNAGDNRLLWSIVQIRAVGRDVSQNPLSHTSRLVNRQSGIGLLFAAHYADCQSHPLGTRGVKKSKKRFLQVPIGVVLLGKLLIYYYSVHLITPK